MFFKILMTISLLLPTIHIVLFPKDRSVNYIARTYLNYLLPLTVGLGGLVAFLGHTMHSDDVARSIGWPPGNPFQLEVAVANLAFSVLGFLCIRFRDNFRLAAILGYGVFLEGAACVHLREIIQAGNWSINNAGPVLAADIVFPVLLLAIWLTEKFSTVASPTHGI